MKCKECGSEISEQKVKTRIVHGVKYEIETHDFNKKLSEITIPKGWRLWTAEECFRLHNDPTVRGELMIENCWFLIQQPFAYNQIKRLVAGFMAYSDRALLSCGRNQSYANSSLGVRFARDLKKVKR